MPQVALLRSIKGLCLAAPLLLLQACDFGNDSTESSNPLEGIWNLRESRITWTQDGASHSDTIRYDSSNIYEQHLYLIQGQAVIWASYDPDREQNGGTTLERFQQIGPAEWLLGDDTVTAERHGNRLEMHTSSVFDYTDEFGRTNYRYDNTVEFTLYQGVFPPPAWYVPPGETDSVSPEILGKSLRVAVGESLPDYLPLRGENWYSFIAGAGQIYMLRTFGTTDTYLQLYNRTATRVLKENDDLVDVNAIVEWKCQASGVYYFRVDGYDSTATGAYTLSVTQLENLNPGILFKGTTSATEPPPLFQKNRSKWKWPGPWDPLERGL